MQFLIEKFLLSIKVKYMRVNDSIVKYKFFAKMNCFFISSHLFLFDENEQFILNYSSKR